MAYEVEQKHPLPAAKPVLTRLAALGIRWDEPVEQVDRYYRHPARDFAQTDEALRIRRVGNDNVITYKGPKLDPLTKTRREIELPLAPGEAGERDFDELLRALGFTPVAEVRKSRRPGELTWQGHEVTVSLDDVIEVGQFLELEVLAESDQLDAARALVRGLAEELALPPGERRSYLEMLLTARGAE